MKNPLKKQRNICLKILSGRLILATGAHFQSEDLQISDQNKYSKFNRRKSVAFVGPVLWCRRRNSDPHASLKDCRFVCVYMGDLGVSSYRFFQQHIHCLQLNVS
jgi:hypothetical protein